MWLCLFCWSHFERSFSFHLSSTNTIGSQFMLLFNSASLSEANWMKNPSSLSFTKHTLVQLGRLCLLSSNSLEEPSLRLIQHLELVLHKCQEIWDERRRGDLDPKVFWNTNLWKMMKLELEVMCKKNLFDIFCKSNSFDIFCRKHSQFEIITFWVL